MLCNPLLTCTKSVNQVMSACNRPQLLKLRWFEVSKNLLTWAHSEFETEVSFSPLSSLCQLAANTLLQALQD